MVANITRALMSASEVTRGVRRREILAGAIAMPALGAAKTTAAAAIGDDAHWATIAAEYDRPPGIVQLEHGNWGAMARPVREAHVRHMMRVNRDTSYYARRSMGTDIVAAQKSVADLLGVAPDEVALTRNATEALRTLIMGYRRLQPGDQVLYADHDYDAMQHCMDALRTRRGVDVVRISLPEAASDDALIEAYAKAINAHPRLKLILLTHLGHRSGMMLPVAEISDLARSRGADVIVDAAHSFGQIDYRIPDLRADFVGINLHKWMGAPLGIGAMIVRRARVADIDRDPASDPASETGIRGLAHIGTTDFAAILTLPDALAFLNRAGPLADRAKRLRALRDHWVDLVREDAHISVLTSDAPGMAGAITSFRLMGERSAAGNAAFAKRLLDEFGIFTVMRTGLSGGACIRVTPSLASSMEDVDRLARALRDIVSKGA